MKKIIKLNFSRVSLKKIYNLRRRKTTFIIMNKIIFTLLTLTLGALIASSCNTTNISSYNEKQSIHLPDGSIVLLNKNSTVRYNTSFEDRSIELDGEAFFIVEKGKVPFVVTTPSGTVTVLGTAFNVKSDDEQLEVEVEKGSIEMKVDEQIQKIKRGECAIYNKSKDLFEKGKAEFEHHIWTEDFQDDLEEIGHEIKKSGRKIGKEFKKLGRKIKDEIED